jgi:uncharacterized protein (DUF2141 family)
MTLIISIALLVLSSVFTNTEVLNARAMSETTFDIKLNIKNITANKGNIMVAVFKEKKDFLDETRAFLKISVPVADLANNGLIPILLPQGTYAIAVFHDTNSNGKLDRNWFYYPTEPFGFSNSASTNFGPPTFESAAIAVEKDMTVEIKLS